MAIKGKKGVFFTFIAVLIIMIILMAFSIGKREIALTSRIPLIRTRSTQANNYVRSLDASLTPRILMDSGRRALYAIIDEAIATGPISAADQEIYLSELVIDGTLSGAPSAHMTNHTFPERMLELTGIIQDSMRINTTYTINDWPSGNAVRLVQDNNTGPWYVRAEMNITFVVNASLMSWNTTRLITAQIPIEGLRDPFFANSYNSPNPPEYIPIIKRTQVRRDSWTRLLFIEHVRNMTYDYNDLGNAPDFLTRLADNTQPGSKCCGIEVPINPDTLHLDFTASTSNAYNWTYMDHCFFGRTADFCNGTTYKVSDFTSMDASAVGETGYRFGLTAYYISRYNLEDNGTIR